MSRIIRRTRWTHVIDQAQGENWVLYHGDCVDAMRGLPDKSIHYSIFSPPFANLYCYSNSPRDMGNCRTNEEFSSTSAIS